MSLTILGYASLILIGLGGAAFAVGLYSMSESSGDAKMGGAIFILFGCFPGGLGLLLGLLWLIFK